MPQLPRPLPGIGGDSGGPPQPPEDPIAEASRQIMDEAREELRLQQSLPLGILGGAVAALVGAAIWAAITAGTDYQIGWMAVGVGLLVGLAVRRLGKGQDNRFRATGAVLALLGCAAGNLFAGCFVLARALSQESGTPVEFLDVLTAPAVWPAIMQAMFHPMDVLFYAIAVYEGWRLSAA